MKAASRRISERTLREKIKRVKSEEDRPRNARTMEAEIMALRFFFFFSVSSGRLSAASLIGVIARFRLGRGLQGDRKEEQRKRKHPEGVKGKGGKKNREGDCLSSRRESRRAETSDGYPFFGRSLRGDGRVSARSFCTPPKLHSRCRKKTTLHYV